MSKELQSFLAGEILEEDVEISIKELCKSSHLSFEYICELVEYGVIEPSGKSPSQWRFRGTSIRRVQQARRLKKDLGLNSAGIAIVLELLEELESLKNKLNRITI